MPPTLRTDVRGGQDLASGRRSVRTTFAAVIVALLTLFTLSASAQAASVPAGFAGVGGWSWPTTAQSQQLGADGVGTVRAGVAWDWVEHNQGTRSWGGVDRLVRDAADDGHELILVINGCTVWACGATRTPPATDAARAAFQDFIAAAVRRYGAGGAYWAANPSLRPARIDWQIWNEVNVGADWPNPTTAGYAALLAQTSQTIKAIDPAARVVTSGLAELPADDSGAPLSTFLGGLENEPGFKQAADVVAVHGYADDPAGVARILDTTRRVMDAAGDNRPIWVTELGWGSGGPAHALAVSPQTQAAYLRESFDTMIACRDRWSLDKAVWFALQDVTPQALGEPDYWGLHTGLYEADGTTAKPARDAFREFAGGRELPSGRGSSCNLAGGASRAAATAASRPPVVTIVKAPAFVGKAAVATRSASGATRLEAKARAKVDFVTDMGNSGRAECSLNGAAFTPCSTPYVIPRDHEGSFQLAVRAIDRTGTMSALATTSWSVDLTAPQTVFKKKPPKRSSKRSVRVRFGTRAVRLGQATAPEVVTYQCSLNNGKWKTCAANFKAKAKRAGKQVLRVRAVDQAGNVDPRGATAKFTVAGR